VIQRLAEGFADERSGREKQLDSGDNVSTEDLRLSERALERAIPYLRPRPEKVSAGREH
jgi:hypothetical protein